MFNHQSMK